MPGRLRAAQGSIRPRSDGTGPGPAGRAQRRRAAPAGSRPLICRFPGRPATAAVGSRHGRTASGEAVQVTIDLAVSTCVRLGLGSPPTYAAAFRLHADADITRPTWPSDWPAPRATAPAGAPYSPLDGGRVHADRLAGPADLRRHSTTRCGTMPRAAPEVQPPRGSGFAPLDAELLPAIAPGRRPPGRPTGAPSGLAGAARATVLGLRRTQTAEVRPSSDDAGQDHP